MTRRVVINQDKQGTFNIGIHWNWCIYKERLKISSIPKGFRLEFMRGIGQKYNFHESSLPKNDTWCHNIEWFGEGKDKKDETTKVKCFQSFHSSFYLVKRCLSFIQLGSKNSIQCYMLLRVLTNIHLCMFLWIYLYFTMFFRILSQQQFSGVWSKFTKQWANGKCYWKWDFGFATYSSCWGKTLNVLILLKNQILLH